MIGREKVLKGVECCRNFNPPDDWDCPEECPYSIDSNPHRCCTFNPLLNDVIALLKEQEPRVLTLEEVRDEAEYMFLEKRSETWSDLFGCAIRGDWDGYGMDLLLGEDDYIRGMWENYGKTWRCWTARPTDEQRRAVKWDA